MSAMPVYLDHNATTPTDPRVLDRMLPYFADRFGNSASRDHTYGWEAAEAVEEARREVADIVAARPAEVIFSSGATESIGLAIGHLLPSDGTVVSSTSEHAAVLSACRLAANGGATVVHVRTDGQGRVGLEECEELVRHHRPSVVCLHLANNEIGTVQPVREAAAIAHGAGAALFCDVTQALGKLAVDVDAEELDAAAFSAHKLYGPKGVGALFVRRHDSEIRVVSRVRRPEVPYRPGTANVPGIVGFGEACRVACGALTTEVSRQAMLRDRLEEGIRSQVPGVWVNGDRANRICNTTNIGFKGIDARTLIRDMHDIAVSTRSACSSGDSGPSHVLKAIGLSDEDCYSCIRFSLGRFTTEAEIDYTIGKVVASAHRLRRSKSA
jgi:cysteine desulfurase